MKLRNLYPVGILAACVAHVLLGLELANGAHRVPARALADGPGRVAESVHGR